MMMTLPPEDYADWLIEKLVLAMGGPESDYVSETDKLLRELQERAEKPLMVVTMDHGLSPDEWQKVHSAMTATSQGYTKPPAEKEDPRPIFHVHQEHQLFLDKYMSPPKPNLEGESIVERCIRKGYIDKEAWTRSLDLRRRRKP